MIAKPQMMVMALEAQAAGLDARAAEVRLHELGPAAKQKDLNKLRTYFLTEAGKLRAKKAGVLDAEKKRQLNRILGAGDEGTALPPQGVQKEA